MNIPKELRYTKEHEWVKIEGDRLTVGVTDYAQTQMGDVVYVELPEVGTEVTQGDGFAVVESVKAVSDVYAPVSGEVLEVNEELTDSPEKVNQDPYGEGWLAVLKITDPDQIKDLLDSTAYAEVAAEGGH